MVASSLSRSSSPWAVLCVVSWALLAQVASPEDQIVPDPQTHQDAAPQAVPMSQDDARQLTNYMMQQWQGPPLNLANMNDRNLAGRPPPRVAPNGGYGVQTSNLPIRPPLNQATNNPPSRQQPQRHSQLLVPASTQKRSDHQRMMPMPVPQYQATLNGGGGGGSSLKKLIHPSLVVPANCITQAKPLASTCEDRLIKRLSQDATEGRTVVDVSRRVCCALFFHKECVDSQVLKVCPDSNPNAADLLLGSRNLDLTMSCQRFNRDGCNRAAPSFRSAPHYMILLLLALGTAALGHFLV